MKIKNLLNVFVKNFKVLWRSKLSAIVMVLIPLAIVLLVGLAFSTSSLSSLKIGTYSQDYNNLSQSSLNSLEEKNYQIQKFSSENECINSIKKGDSKICIIYPDNLSITSKEAIQIYTDKSRMDIAYYLVNDIQSQISKESLGISKNEVQRIMEIVKSAEEKISSANKNISDMDKDLTSINNLNSGISSKEASTDSLLNELDSIDSDLEDMGNSSEIYGIRNDVQNLKKDVEGVKNSFNTVSENSEKITLEVSSLKQSLSSLEDKIGNIHETLNSSEITEVEKIVSPIKSNVKTLNSGATNWHYLFPKFLYMVILFCSMILASSLVIRERKAGAYFRNSITSTSDSIFVLGNYLTCLFIVFIQLSIVLTAIHLIMKTSITSILLELSVAIFLSASIFIFIGMLIGYVFKSEETAMIVSISIIALLLFFSNAIFPIEAISSNFQKYLQYNPAAISNELFRKIILFKYKIVSLTKEIYILTGTLGVSFGLTLLFKSFSKKKNEFF